MKAANPKTTASAPSLIRKINDKQKNEKDIAKENKNHKTFPKLLYILHVCLL